MQAACVATAPNNIPTNQPEFPLFPHPMSMGACHQPSFLQLLKIPDHCQKPPKLDLWLKFLKETKEEDISLLAHRHSESFMADIARQTVHINETVFHEKEMEDPEKVAILHNFMLQRLAAASECFENAFDLRALYRLRYLVEDLMNQSLFAIDPHFLGSYCEAYSRHKQLLVSLGYDESLLQAAGKNPHIALRCEKGFFYITAIQYWKVVRLHNPEEIAGFDAMCVQLFFRLSDLMGDAMLLHPNSHSLTVMFHGYRTSLNQISY